MDAVRLRQRCWALLPELNLFNLSSKSDPSEVKSTVDGPGPATMNSTFFTGRADMAVITLKDTSQNILSDEETRREFLRRCKHYQFLGAIGVDLSFICSHYTEGTNICSLAYHWRGNIRDRLGASNVGGKKERKCFRQAYF